MMIGITALIACGIVVVMLIVGTTACCLCHRCRKFFKAREERFHGVVTR